MHNSAFYLSLAALARSTSPMMSHHNEDFKNHPALILQDRSLLDCFSPKLLPRAPRHTSAQEAEGRHSPTNQMTAAGLTIDRSHNEATNIKRHTHECCKGGSDAEQIISLN